MISRSTSLLAIVVIVLSIAFAALMIADAATPVLK
jgi:hypothetical protein